MNKIILFFFILLVGSAIGCSNSTTPVIQPEDIDNIKIALKDYDETDQQHVYSLVLQNNSPHVIKQNSVFMGYQVKIDSGVKGSAFLFRATGNKLDIQPSEQVGLSVFVPKDELPPEEKLNKNRITFEIQGYLNEVKLENSFDKGQSIDINNFKASQ